MKKFFIFSLSLSLLLTSCAFVYQTWRNEYRKWQLDSFYAQQFELLFEKKFDLQSYVNLHDMEKLEQRMLGDGYNYEEVSHLAEAANKKNLVKAVHHSLESPDKKLRARIEPELAHIKNSLEPEILKRFYESVYLDKFQKAFRKQPPQSYQEIDVLEKEMLLESYSMDEIKKIKQQALLAYQEELYTDYLTRVEITP